MLPEPSCFSSPPIRCARPGRARHRPRPREVVVARVGQERLARRRAEPRIDRRQIGRRRDLPRLARVGDEQVAQQDHRRAVGDGDPHRLVDGLEALPGARRGQHRQRRLAVAAVQRLQQIRLLGLGRHAGRRAGALDVDDHHRQLQRDGQPDRLGLQIEPRTGRARDAERTAERRAQRDRRGRDLVLGLDRAHAHVLPARQRVQAGPRRA